MTVVIAVILAGIMGGSACKKSLSPDDLIVLEVSQNVWKLNYTNSLGNIEIILRGAGVDKILLDSIEMKGDKPSAQPLKALSAAYDGNQVRVQFQKYRVMELLMNPTDGTTHTITVTFSMKDKGDRIEVHAEVTVQEGSDDGTDPSALSLEIDPDEWSLNYSRSSGTVEAFIRGEGIDQIDLTSIEMKGDNPDAAPLPTVSVSMQGDHIHARFPKNRVLDLLLNPEPGSVHTIIVSFLETGGTERLELTAEITIEDDEDDEIDPEELSLEIDPDEWSLNYYKSSGTVEAFIRGEGIDQIDLSSIEMKGDNPTAAPLAAVSVTLKRTQIHAKFAKNQVLDLLLNPERGSTHTIIISFLEIGGTERLELTAEITIEDDEDDGEDPEEPSPLELQLAPDVWNLNYYGASGNVQAFLRGEGIENIDLDTIEMYGDNPSAEPLQADSASRQGNHVKAEFPKNKVLDLLLDPAAGTTHTVTVTYIEINGSVRLEVSTEVRITGSSD
jgi:hypothetical protein